LEVVGMVGVVPQEVSVDRLGSLVLLWASVSLSVPFS